jgi:hypothetical protein
MMMVVIGISAILIYTLCRKKILSATVLAACTVHPLLGRPILLSGVGYLFHVRNCFALVLLLVFRVPAGFLCSFKKKVKFPFLCGFLFYLVFVSVFFCLIVLPPIYNKRWGFSTKFSILSSPHFLGIGGSII